MSEDKTKKCEKCDGTGLDPDAAEVLEKTTGVTCLGCGGKGWTAVAEDVVPGKP